MIMIGMWVFFKPTDWYACGDDDNDWLLSFVGPCQYIYNTLVFLFFVVCLSSIGNVSFLFLSQFVLVQQGMAGYFYIYVSIHKAKPKKSVLCVSIFQLDQISKT